MKIKVYTQDGKEKSEVNLSSDFMCKVSDNTLSNYINYIRANLRNPIANTLDRGQVSGGGKKPWKQKGTGHARVGSSRSPLWTHGGVTFGPTKDRNFTVKMNQKTRRSARKSIFARFADAGRFKIIDKIEIDKPKTSTAQKIIENIAIDGKIGFFLGKSELQLGQSFRNLPFIVLNSQDNVDILNLISSDWIVMTEEAFKELTEDKKAINESNN